MTKQSIHFKGPAKQRKILSRIVAVIVSRGTSVDDVCAIADVLEVPVERLIVGDHR